MTAATKACGAAAAATCIKYQRKTNTRQITQVFPYIVPDSDAVDEEGSQ
jgi:hypothetical protein